MCNCNCNRFVIRKNNKYLPTFTNYIAVPTDCADAYIKPGDCPGCNPLRYAVREDMANPAYQVDTGTADGITINAMDIYYGLSGKYYTQIQVDSSTAFTFYTYPGTYAPTKRIDTSVLSPVGTITYSGGPTMSASDNGAGQSVTLSGFSGQNGNFSVIMYDQKQGKAIILNNLIQFYHER